LWGKRKREYSDASIDKIDEFTGYAQAQSGFPVFALVESIRGG
jgi:hypothetical protein